MRVVVTGAAGRLGRRVCEELRAAGHVLHEVDVVPAVGEHTVADLLNPEVSRGALQKAEAVVHAAGQLGCDGQSGAEVYLENVSMAYHVLAAAAEGAVRKVVLASSIQVFGWGADPSQSVWGFEPEYLPLDDACARRPGTLYALGKCAIEDLMELQARAGAFDAVSLRLPRLMEKDDYRLWKEKMAREQSFWIAMSYRQAARLVRRCLETALPGYRAYVAADEDIGEAAGRQAFLQRHYPSRSFPAELEGFVDCARAIRETGWKPARWEEEGGGPE